MLRVDWPGLAVHVEGPHGQIRSHFDTVPVKMFFTKDATNHPSTGLSPEPPNWYYYWEQDVPPPSTVTLRQYVNADTGIDNSIGMWQAFFDANQQIVTTDITIYRRAGDSYRICTKTLVHENKHEDDYRNVVWLGFLNWAAMADMDLDLLNNQWETANKVYTHHGEPGYTPADHYQGFKDWTEARAQAAEAAFPDLSSSRDWASPGTNY